MGTILELNLYDIYVHIGIFLLSFHFVVVSIWVVHGFSDSVLVKEADKQRSIV